MTLSEAPFRIQRAGQDRARREGQRNVHAYISGVVNVEAPRDVAWRRGTYNPFVNDTFVDEAGEPVLRADWVRLDGVGLRWADET